MKLSPEIRELLEACGLPWATKMGSKHIKIYVGGKFSAVYPRGKVSENHYRAERNTLAQLRRAIKDQST